MDSKEESSRLKDHLFRLWILFSSMITLVSLIGITEDLIDWVKLFSQIYNYYDNIASPIYENILRFLSIPIDLIEPYYDYITVAILAFTSVNLKSIREERSIWILGFVREIIRWIRDHETSNHGQSSKSNDEIGRSYFGASAQLGFGLAGAAALGAYLYWGISSDGSGSRGDAVVGLAEDTIAWFEVFRSLDDIQDFYFWTKSALGDQYFMILSVFALIFFGFLRLFIWEKVESENMKILHLLSKFLLVANIIHALPILVWAILGFALFIPYIVFGIPIMMGIMTAGLIILSLIGFYVASAIFAWRYCAIFLLSFGILVASNYIYLNYFL